MRIMDWSSDVCSSDLDAPPEHEDCRPFLHVTGLLQQAGLNVPAILAQNTQEVFLLLSDLGRQTYYQAIQAGLDDDSLQKIYRDALAALVRLQTAPTTGLPAYDAQRLSQAQTVFPECYSGKHCHASLSETEQGWRRNACALSGAHTRRQRKTMGTR